MNICSDVLYHHQFNHFPVTLSFLNVYPHEVASRDRDPQLQVVENYSYLVNLRGNICYCVCLNTHFIPNTSDLTN